MFIQPAANIPTIFPMVSAAKTVPIPRPSKCPRKSFVIHAVATRQSTSKEILILDKFYFLLILEVAFRQPAREFPRQHFRLSVRQNKGYSFVWLRPCGYFYLFQR